MKCLVWDLDNTLWNGTLLEKDSCRLKPGIKPILRTLDRRGILLSIASANDEDLATAALKKKGIFEYFLHPQISWSNKASSLQIIADKLNLGLDSLGFIDDEPFELDQIRKVLPAVSIFPAEEYRKLLNKPELTPAFLTEEASRRRQMYLQGSLRTEAQARSGVSRREFLKSCRTQMTIRKAACTDLPRILELMHRTHQLNATGLLYSEEEVRSFLNGSLFRMYVFELKDRYVNYGTIGVAVCRCVEDRWELFSFLLSCRVLARGVGFFSLAWLQYRAYCNGAKEFWGFFKKQARNHRMQMLFSLSGFTPLLKKDSGLVVYRKACQNHLQIPEWLTLDPEES